MLNFWSKFWISSNRMVICDFASQLIAFWWLEEHLFSPESWFEYRTILCQVFSFLSRFSPSPQRTNDKQAQKLHSRNSEQNVTTWKNPWTKKHSARWLNTMRMINGALTNMPTHKTDAMFSIRIWQPREKSIELINFS